MCDLDARRNNIKRSPIKALDDPVRALGSILRYNSRYFGPLSIYSCPGKAVNEGGLVCTLALTESFYTYEACTVYLVCICLPWQRRR